MARIIIFINLLFLSVSCMAQEEHFFLHTDKKMCYAGDTVWFRGYLFYDTLTSLSRSFYAELYDDQLALVNREFFPISRSGSGQMELPDKPGCYWLRAYTLNASCQTIIPLNVINPNDITVIRSFSKPPKGVPSDSTITLTKEGNEYVIRINKNIRCNYSVAVTDTADPSTTMLPSFPMPPNYSRKWDTIGLTYHGTLQRFKKKRNENPEIVMYFQQDSVVPYPQTLLTDMSGNITFYYTNFFDSAYIRYRQNVPGDNNAVLTLSPDTLPDFTPPPASAYRTDSMKYHVPDAGNYPSLNGKRLKEIQVKARWHDRHLALNKRYVKSPDFAAIEHFTFDLRSPINPGRIYYALEYLGTMLGWKWDATAPESMSLSGGTQFYIDEQLVSREIVAQRPLRDFAYAKVFSELHPPYPSICLYTRKGNDLKILPSDLNVTTIKGYDRPLTWSTPDRVTWLWEPYITEKTHRMKIPAKTFKIVLEGITAKGEAIHFEKIVK